MQTELPPCHHCGDPRLVGKTPLPFDRLLAVMGLSPFECLGCGARAYRFPREEPVRDRAR